MISLSLVSSIGFFLLWSSRVMHEFLSSSIWTIGKWPASHARCKAVPLNLVSLLISRFGWDNKKDRQSARPK